MSRLNGKVALVTRAARGIGAAIAQAMVDEGAKVVIGDVPGMRKEDIDIFIDRG